MTMLIELKEKMKEIYGAYSIYLLPVFRFLLALAVFLNLNRTLGYLKVLDSVYVVLILSLICAIIPLRGMAVLAMLVILGHCFALHFVVAGVALVLMLLLWVLYLRFAPKEALALVVTPLAFSLHIPALVPIGFGLACGPLSAVSVSCGVVIYYLCDLVQGKISVMAGEEKIQVVSMAQEMLNGLFRDEKMLLTIVACVLVVLIVNSIRRSRADYAWQIAVVAGTVAYIVIMTAGKFFLDVELSLPVLFVGTIASCLLGMILEFFLFGADYTRSEYLEFEDDEYYYYVKAIPKNSVTKRDHTVKHIEAEAEDETEETEEMHVYEMERSRKEVQEDAPEASEKAQEDLMAEDAGNPEELEAEDAGEAPPLDDGNYDEVDYESVLEDTLRNL